MRSAMAKRRLITGGAASLGGHLPGGRSPERLKLRLHRVDD